MHAVIMAGGEGTRLRPLTSELPKPLVPVANQPVMETILRHLAAHGFKNVTATLHYLPPLIKSVFGDGEQFGVSLSYREEIRPLGTAGSVRMTQGMFPGDFLVISGDCLTDIDLTDAVAFHLKKAAVATIVLKRVARPLEYGIVVTDGDGRILRFLEKPGWGEVFSDTANTGIYILSPEIFKYYPETEAPDFSRDVFPRVLEEKAGLYGYIAEGYWCDIGDPSVYMQANRDVLDG
ncbi:MAG TPA: nucleotidyltransferase, partial [Clostridiales bacterium]|nr:nucleotidyltransferase [Clostridiales bacterium]